MNKSEAKEKTLELFDKYVKNICHDRIDKVLNSGALALEDYGNNYELPKLLLCDALREAVTSFVPLTAEGKKNLKNLDYF